MTESVFDGSLQSLQDEHRGLSKQIADLKLFWREVNELGQGPKYEEMGMRVQVFRELLASHFANEERGGYLAQALNRAPEFAERAKQLEQQHQLFLDDIDRFIARLQTCDSAFHCWQEVREEFDDFLQRLHVHETEETQIVETAIGNKES